MSERDRGPSGRLASGPRTRLTVGAAVVLVVLALAIAVVMSAVTAAGSAPRPVTPSAGPSADAPGVTVQSGGGIQAADPVLVHVLGEVRAPGIYELTGDARVLDAVAAAGGLTDAADTAAVNLARRVVDGEQLVVPKTGEAPPATSGPGGSGGAGGGSATGAGGVISLSTASVEQLDALPRIGPTIAQRIVDWREAGGRFTSVDDLLQIDGIGVKTVENLRDLVVP